MKQSLNLCIYKDTTCSLQSSYNGPAGKKKFSLPQISAKFRKSSLPSFLERKNSPSTHAFTESDNSFAKIKESQIEQFHYSAASPKTLAFSLVPKEKLVIFKQTQISTRAVTLPDSSQDKKLGFLYYPQIKNIIPEIPLSSIKHEKSPQRKLKMHSKVQSGFNEKSKNSIFVRTPNKKFERGFLESQYENNLKQGFRKIKPVKPLQFFGFSVPPQTSLILQ